MLSWKRFELKNENCENFAFEELCRKLFKRRFPDVEFWPAPDPNNPGIEMPPVYEPRLKQVIGFQAKYFALNTTANNFYKQIENSVDMTIRYYVDRAAEKNERQITEFYLYCNHKISTQRAEYRRINQKMQDNNIRMSLICDESILDEVDHDEVLRKDFFESYLEQDSNEILHKIWNNMDNQTPSQDMNILEQVQICLAHYIERVDREFDWNKKEFTSIEVEVEMELGNNRKKKYFDLLECLRKNRNKKRIFLVLGDPGSGKSVSLRKYCHDWLIGNKDCKLLPLYINLKYWNTIWTETYLPKKKDVREFLCSMFLEAMDADTEKEKNAWTEWFLQMYETGRWYYVFDSFDELPCLISSVGTENLIAGLSQTLYQFVTDAKQQGCVIASRHFRQPAENDDRLTIVNLRPFDEVRMRTMFAKSIGDADCHVRNIFQNHSNWICPVSNPFILSMLIQYMETNEFAMPPDQMTLYENLLNHRLNLNKGRISDEGLDSQIILKVACIMAEYMQNHQEYARECPIDKLELKYPDFAWMRIIMIMERMKICKYGGKHRSVSFVHRRFQEYFLVRNRIENHICFDESDLDSIRTNGGTRDALVLYNEITDVEESERILKYCLTEIHKNFDAADNLRSVKCVELINTVTFMTEAFQNRREVFEPYTKNLKQILDDVFNPNLYLKDSKEIFHINLIVQEAFAASVCLLPSKDESEIVQKVFSLNNPYLETIVIRAARECDKLEKPIEYEIFTRYYSESIASFYRHFRKRRYELSLSSKMTNIRILQDFIFIRNLIILTILPLLGMMYLLSFKYDSIAYSSSYFLLFKNYALVGNHNNLKLLLLVTTNFFAAMAQALVLEENIEYTIIEIIESGIHIFLLLWCFDKFNIFIAFLDYALILFIYNLIGLPVTVRYGKYAVKKYKALIFFLLVFILLCIWSNIIWWSWIPVIFISVLMLSLLFSGIFYLFCLMRPVIQSMTRKKAHYITRQELQENLNKTKDVLEKYYYLRDLKKDKTILTGNWPDGKEPYIDDPEVRKLLSDLDGQNLKISKIHF